MAPAPKIQNFGEADIMRPIQSAKEFHSRRRVHGLWRIGGTGRIDIRTRRDGEFFLVQIADNGSGILPEARPQIFAVPFLTTKGGLGTGLGLVISHRIVVERHHGKIDFSTGPDGTQFNVRLPFESPAHA